MIERFTACSRSCLTMQDYGALSGELARLGPHRPNAA
jgi:hypothetical protein